MLTLKKRTVLLIVLCLALSLALMAAKKGPGPAPDARTFSVPMTGAAERPGPGDPDGSGTAVITLNHVTGQVCWEITVKNILLPASAAHIHVAPPDAPGPVVVGLGAPDASGQSSGCTNADPALVKAILANPSGYYVNVHNSLFPAGAVRGQLSN